MATSPFPVFAWAAANPSLNCSWNDVLTLKRKLGKLGVVITDVIVEPQGQASDMENVTQTAKDILAQGAAVTDALFYQVQIADDLPGRLHDAAQLLADFSNADPVAKVMADIYGALGQDASIRANAAKLLLPGVQASVTAALATL